MDTDVPGTSSTSTSSVLVKQDSDESQNLQVMEHRQPIIECGEVMSLNPAAVGFVDQSRVMKNDSAGGAACVPW